MHGDDAGDNNHEGAGGSADLDVGAAQRRDDKAANDRGIDSGLRRDAGGDSESHGQRQRHQADRDAGDKSARNRCGCSLADIGRASDGKSLIDLNFFGHSGGSERGRLPGAASRQKPFRIRLHSSIADRMFLFDFFRSFLPLHNPSGSARAISSNWHWRCCWYCYAGARGGEPVAQRLAARAVGACWRWRRCRWCCGWRCWRTLRRPRPAGPTISATGCWRTRCGTSAWRTRRIRCTGSSKPFRPARSRHTVRSSRSGKASRWRWAAGIWAFLGGCGAVRRGVVCAVLLDAARVDHTGLGAGGRIARGDPVWAAAVLDEYILGRCGFGHGGLPGVRFAAAATRRGASADGAAWAGTGHCNCSRGRSNSAADAAVLCAACRIWRTRRQWRKSHGARRLCSLLLPAVGLMAAAEHAVTGSWTTLPYELSRYQYGVPTTFTFQPNPVPHRALTPAQQLDYQAQSAVHDGPGFWSGWWSALDSIASFSCRRSIWRCRCSSALERTKIPVGGGDAVGICHRGQFLSLLLSALHRGAGLCLSYGGWRRLERLIAWSSLAARLIVLLCAAHFIFWYGIHSMRDDNVRLAMAKYETWDYLNQGDPEGRIAD